MPFNTGRTYTDKPGHNQDGIMLQISQYNNLRTREFVRVKATEDTLQALPIYENNNIRQVIAKLPVPRSLTNIKCILKTSYIPFRSYIHVKGQISYLV